MFPQNGMSSNNPFEGPSLNGQILDAAQAKQMAALTAVGQARQQGNLKGSSLVSGANSTNPGLFFGPTPNQAPPASPLLERSMTQNPPTRPQNLFREKANSFTASLASLFAKRNQPLPPALTGVPTPNYDPISSPFKDIQTGSEPGIFKIAGKDLHLFQLWSVVWQRGGFVNLNKENGWQAIVPLLDLPESAQPSLIQFYSKILFPFEQLYRQNIMEQQKKAQAMRPSGPSANGPSTQRGPSMGLAAQSSSSSSLPPPSMQSDGNSAILDLPTLDQDLQGVKRKLEQEEEGKRTRQKTETVDSVFPVGSASDPSFVGPHPGLNPTSQTPTPATMTGPPRTRQELSRRKIEYKPLVREIETYGGRDLKAIEAEILNSSRRPLRDLNEWGTIDIDALTMSIRSKLSTELSYALTTFTLLSTMKGQTPTAGFPITNCPDLLEEVLDLVEDLAFGDVKDVPEPINIQDNPHIITNRELVETIYEAETQPFAGLERRQGSKSAQIGPRQRPANLILTVTNIIRNLCTFSDNVPFLANHKRLLDFILRLCGVSEDNSTYIPTSQALSLTDVLAVRKDVLNILSLLAPTIVFSEGATSLSTARRIFHLIASYLVDPVEAVSPLASVQFSGVPLGGTLKPPALADLALEVFTRLGQSDANRLLFSKAVSRPSLWFTFVAIVHRLPVLDVDFQLAVREVWLSYVEKTVMSLYTLGFIFPPELKARVKADRSLGFKSVMMRIIQKLFVQNNPETRQFFSVIVRRIIETLKLIDDGEDSFDNSKGIAPTLSFGIGYGEVGENDFERGTGMLGGYTDIGWDILLCREVQADEVMFAELESLIRVEY
ncbi:hypothetical protein GYMLUDRAFT_235505 [Collybiopsis luxurians FD-317 M1]|nr:hypothetical protein GYMLUDRAFT_235505 [Collybiopsis luxurians FD-317 M1]